MVASAYYEPAEGITASLKQWSGGDSQALDGLFPMVYRELHVLAEKLMKHERVNHTLQTTALVHEAFLSLSSGQKPAWRSRTHFFAVAARLMRHILVDHARSLGRVRRGGGAKKLSINGMDIVGENGPVDIILLNDALDRLAEIDERKARVVEYRFFGGLSVEETAEILEVSQPTVILDTRLAKAWLYDNVCRGKRNEC